jgi:hypothetical protein
MCKIFYNQRLSEVILVLISGAFLGTPFQILNIQLSLLLLICLCIMFGYFILFEKNKVSKYSLVSKPYLLVLLFIPVVSALRSNVIFGQSFLNGISANLNYLLFIIVIYFYFYYKNVKNANEQLEKSILILGWISVLILVPIKILYADLDFIVRSLDGLAEYKFSVYSISSPFIVWAGFIYLAKFKFNKKLINILFFLLFVSFQIIFSNARSYTVFLFICLVIFFVRELNAYLKFKLNSFFIIFVFAFLIISFLTPSVNKFILEKSALFTDSFVALKGKNVEDMSANLRIIETETAVPYIEKYYLLGVGVLKQSTKEAFIDGFLYPTDIGLIGVIFNYGIIITIVLLYQLKLFYKTFKSPTIKKNPFILGTAYYLLLYYLTSITTGSFVYNIGMVFTLLGILIYGNLAIQKQENDNRCIRKLQQ